MITLIIVITGTVIGSAVTKVVWPLAQTAYIAARAKAHQEKQRPTSPPMPEASDF